MRNNKKVYCFVAFGGADTVAKRIISVTIFVQRGAGHNVITFFLFFAPLDREERIFHVFRC